MQRPLEPLDGWKVLGGQALESREKSQLEAATDKFRKPRRWRGSEEEAEIRGRRFLSPQIISVYQDFPPWVPLVPLSAFISELQSGQQHQACAQPWSAKLNEWFNLRISETVGEILQQTWSERRSCHEETCSACLIVWTEKNENVCLDCLMLLALSLEIFSVFYSRWEVLQIVDILGADNGVVFVCCFLFFHYYSLCYFVVLWHETWEDCFVPRCCFQSDFLQVNGGKIMKMDTGASAQSFSSYTEMRFISMNYDTEANNSSSD